MTDQEILNKALDKAIANGWEDGNFERAMFATVNQTTGSMTTILQRDWFRVRSTAVMFNHGFAKALWPESSPNYEEIKAQYRGDIFNLRNIDWRDHLKDMVVADDPFKYLQEHGNL